MYKRCKVINSVNDYGIETFWQNIFLARTISKLMLFVPLLTKYFPANWWLQITVKMLTLLKFFYASNYSLVLSCLCILTQFLENRSQYVIVDGCKRKQVNVVSGVPQGGVLCHLLFLLYTSELFSILENKLIGDVDNYTLTAVVPSPSVWVTVAESLSRDLVKVSEWCDLWGIKFNASKT